MRSIFSPMLFSKASLSVHLFWSLKKYNKRSRMDWLWVPLLLLSFSGFGMIFCVICVGKWMNLIRTQKKPWEYLRRRTMLLDLVPLPLYRVLCSINEWLPRGCISIVRRLGKYRNGSVGSFELVFTHFLSAFSDEIVARETWDRGNVNASMKSLKKLDNKCTKSWMSRFDVITTEHDAARGGRPQTEFWCQLRD